MSKVRILVLILTLLLVMGLTATLASADDPPNNEADVIELLPGTVLDGPGPFAPQGMAMFEESEPNDSPAAANALPSTHVVVNGTTVPALPTPDLDYFSFTGSAGDRVYAATMTAFSSGGTDTTLTLFDTDGVTIIEVDVNDGSFGSFIVQHRRGVRCQPTARTYLQVRSTSRPQRRDATPISFISSCRAARRRLRPSPITLTDGGQPLPASGWVNGAIGPAGDNDVFLMSLNAGDTVFLSLDLDPERDGGTSWNGRFGLGAFGNPATILVVNDTNTTSPNSEAFFLTVKAAGTYYVYVDHIHRSRRPGLHLPSLRSRRSPSRLRPVCTTYTSTDVPLAIPTGPGLVNRHITVPGNPIRFMIWMLPSP
jgi:hypothetical protein